MSENTAVAYPTHAELLLRYLQRERDNLVGKLDGLSEYDARRPMTPTGTSLLGLVKHVATVEIGYLGECVGRPWPEHDPVGTTRPVVRATTCTPQPTSRWR